MKLPLRLKAIMKKSLDVPNAHLRVHYLKIYLKRGSGLKEIKEKNKIVTRALKTLKEAKDIFIKDGSIGLDRWQERLRFCELGGGNAALPLEEIARELRNFHYDKWLLIEHDTHLRPPEIDLKKSADILKELFK